VLGRGEENLKLGGNLWLQPEVEQTAELVVGQRTWVAMVRGQLARLLGRDF
jgi:hypothetical protein